MDLNQIAESITDAAQTECRRIFDGSFDLKEKLDCVIYAKQQKGWDFFAEELEADYESERAGRFGEQAA